MHPVCIITNFNYGRFLPQCLDSLINQTHALKKIILVDDGSRDDSIRVASAYRDKTNLVIVQKPNGGQLSCFHAAMGELAADDLVFFLDADDFFPVDYVSTIMRLSGGTPPPFVFSAPHVVADAAVDGDLPPASGATLEWIHRSRALTLGCRLYVGAPTSGLCISFDVLRRLLPYPREEEWRTCADNVLVFGASIHGAPKAFVRGLKFAYRQHESNLYMGRDVSAADQSRHRLRVNRLLRHYANAAGVRRWPSWGEAFSELGSLPAGWPNDHFVRSKSRYVAYRAQARAKSLIGLEQTGG